jgi:endosialidase-like protein
MHRSVQLKTTVLPCLIAGMLICVGLCPRAQATDQGSVLPNGNTADGSGVLINLTTGVTNSGFGFQALNHNTGGSGNTATGYQALYSNSTGNTRNTATGLQALFSNTTGANNVAVGWRALFNNTLGTQNTATGFQALANNKAGNYNSAVGGLALRSNTFGTFNSALGQGALASNVLGNNNTATGAGALFTNFTGVNNTATGFQALNDNVGGFQNTAIGSQALINSTGNGNIGVGYQAGLFVTSGSNNIDIGTQGGAGESGTIRIGTFGIHFTTYIAGILGATTEFNNAVPVVIDTLGQLGTMSSSRRFKKEIKAMDKASEAILALEPVTFHYKNDKTDTPQFGLVAEEVEKINSALVTRDAEGKVFTVRYDAVNAMLLNEFLKEHAQVQQLKATVAQQQKQIEALTAGLQKVTARVETSNSVTCVVSDN